MANGSDIEWTDATWNPVAGCTPVSPGCLQCYAAGMAIRLEAMGQRDYQHQDGQPIAHRHNGRAVFTGLVRTLPDKLGVPLHWKKPRRIFVNSMSDLFHEAVLFEFIDRVFAVMALCPQHTFQVLTKRPERMAEWANDRTRRMWHDDSPMVMAMADLSAKLEPRGDAQNERRVMEKYLGAIAPDRGMWPLPNVWLGTSVENQAAADERIPHLLKCPAAVRFLSCEPLLGAVEFSNVGERADAVAQLGRKALAGISWVIVGGESGPGARPCDVTWIRSIVRQCQAAGVPCFVKQLGAYPRLVLPTPREIEEWGDACLVQGKEGLRIAIRDKKGGAPAEWPHDLRVREFPIPLPGALPGAGAGAETRP
jgi:protein gp37